MQPIRTSIYGLEDYLDIEELNEKANCLAEETAIATDSLNSLMNDLENAEHNLKVIRAQTVDRNRKEKIFYVTTTLVSLTFVAFLLIPTK